MDITKHRYNVVDSVCCKNIDLILSNKSFSDSFKLQEVYAQVLTKLALWYLRSKEVTVIMNYKVEGGKLILKTNVGYTYDNDFDDLEIYLKDGSEFIILEGKLTIEKPWTKAIYKEVENVRDIMSKD